MLLSTYVSDQKNNSAMFIIIPENFVVGQIILLWKSTFASYYENSGLITFPGQAKTGLEIPKRPVSAYLRFAMEARLNMSKEGSLMDQSKIFGQRWKELPEDKKQVVY
jgi:hypothetical protein